MFSFDQFIWKLFVESFSITTSEDIASNTHSQNVYGVNFTPKLQSIVDNIGLVDSLSSSRYVNS